MTYDCTDLRVFLLLATNALTQMLAGMWSEQKSSKLQQLSSAIKCSIKSVASKLGQAIKKCKKAMEFKIKM